VEKSSKKSEKHNQQQGNYHTSIHRGRQTFSKENITCQVKETRINNRMEENRTKNIQEYLGSKQFGERQSRIGSFQI
jgi:hypothetical protein